MEAFEGDHARRQAATAALGAQAAGTEARLPAERAQRFASAFHVVQQHAGVAAAGFAIDLQQGLEAGAEIRHSGIGVGHCARRADGGASAAAGAEVRFDLDMVAIGADRAGGAHVQALRAAGFAGAPVRADPFAILREARLAEFTDHRGQLLRRQRLLQRIGAGRGIALRQVGHADQRLARQVEH